ncbi:MAG: glycoside hydrolase family 3 C-terminal domain-containing protein [Firmicutes bacterium]|nr:glycoside hydrolase family 3 C-terminal domain-containing protein [Bacillota bacterium]
MKKYMDPALPAKDRAEALLREMSLDEKLAQTVGVFAAKGREEEMAAFLPFGVGQISTLEFRMGESLEEIAEWQTSLQKLMMEKSPHHIPAVFHMEGLCGALMQDTTTFPSGAGRGSSFDPLLEEKIGRVVSRQEAALGISQILAPVLDISRDPRMGREAEAYGEDPTLAARMGAALTRGIQTTQTAGRKPESVAKHFLGFHHSLAGIHAAACDAGDHLLYEIYGKSFQVAIKESHLRGIMPCYDTIDGLPIHASKHYLTGLLREEMGFDGVVVSDYSGVANAHNVQGVGEIPAEAGIRCMKAGMDVELPMPECYGQILKDMFESGEADIAVLDRAVLRILEAKFRMGVFEHPFALTGEELEKTVHGEEDEQIARRSAQESLILLKNDGILPLKVPSSKELTIALIGPHADNARYYFGGYTHLSMVEAVYAAVDSMAGVGGGDTSNAEMDCIPGTKVQDDETDVFDEVLRKIKPNCKTLRHALEEAFVTEAGIPAVRVLYAPGYPKAGNDCSGFAEALDLVRQADLVILTLGGKYGTGSIATMGVGIDSTDINLPPAQDAFILEAARLGKPMIGIHFDGRPISSDIADEHLNAIIEAWTPATYAAEVIIDVLLGRISPSGKLPVSVARNAGQIPIFYNHPKGSAWHQGPSIGFQDYVDAPHTPRYPFGFGLSYATFEYSDLLIRPAKSETSTEMPDSSFAEPLIDPLQDVEISLTVTNTGKCTGTEIVQLYLADPQALMTRPVKELQGFARVELAPGETKKVNFTVSPSQMAFLDEDMQWLIEAGKIEVQVGASSEDIRLSGSFRINRTCPIKGQDRRFWADAYIQ